MIKKIVFLFLMAFSSFAQDVPESPNPPRLVNDFVGGLLSASQIDALERKLVAYNDSTSTQITVVIVKTVEPYDIFSYAQALARKWKIGQAGKNNGILLLWAPGDRKIRIHVGYGLEGSITDARSKRIISQIIGPYFKELKYYDGLDKATTQIAAYVGGEFKAEPGQATNGGDEFMAMIIFFFVLMLILWIISKNNKNNNNGNGGRRGYHDSGWPYWTMAGGGSSSGSWGGGGGSDFGGGGFGGFGGGDFGGGGASGDY